MNPSLRNGIVIEEISVTWLLIEFGVAIISGVMTHSLALVAFGIDSIIELVAGLVVLWRLYVEFKSRDTDKINAAEHKASWFLSIAILLLAVYLLVAAISNLIHHHSASTNMLGICLAIVASISMPYLAWIKKQIGAKINSEALKADGCCSMVCAYMSWVLLIGIITNRIFGLWWIDSAMTLIFVIFIIHKEMQLIERAKQRECYCEQSNKVFNASGINDNKDNYPFKVS